MHALLVLNLVVLALAAWFSVFKVVPDAAAARFRYHLWRRRDEVVDDMRRGGYDDDEAPRELVAMFETAIQQSCDITMLNAVLLHVSTRDLPKPHWIDCQGLSDADAEKIRKHEMWLSEEITVKALLGSPSGWLTFFLVIPVGLVVIGLKRLFWGGPDGESLYDATKRHLAKELELDNPSRALLSPNGSYNGGLPAHRFRVHQHV